MKTPEEILNEYCETMFMEVQYISMEAVVIREDAIKAMIAYGEMLLREQTEQKPVTHREMRKWEEPKRDYDHEHKSIDTKLSIEISMLNSKAAKQPKYWNRTSWNYKPKNK